MMKRMIGRFFRWFRKFSDKYCTIDINSDKNAQGLAECLVHGARTEDEKREKCRKQLLQGVSKEDEGRILKHFHALSQETDPLQNDKKISDNSVKKVSTNISVKDVESRIKKVESRDHTKKAEQAISGLQDWPVLKPDKKGKG